MPTFSHFGICVSDLERSVRFYCEGLGFERAERHEIGPEFGGLMELEDLSLTSQFLRRGEAAIELLAYGSPAVTGDASRRALNRLGLTHLSFTVEDVPATAEALVALGGSVIEPTRTTFGEGDQALDFVYCTDPDGIRIELMRLGG